MNELTQTSGFDKQARERIRRQLLRYATEHGIGAPTLRTRIERSDERGRELPQSNLQRFLAATHRTQDIYVDMIERFLAKENAGYDEAELGAVLAAFVGNRATVPVDTEAENEWLFGFAGSYTHWTYGHGEIGGGELYFPPRGKPRGNLKLIPVDGQPYLAAEERDRIRGAETMEEAREIHEGVALASSGALYLFMRNCLTRAPRSAFVQPIMRGDPPAQTRVLEGTRYQFEQEGLSHAAVPLTLTVRVQCLLELDEGPDHG